MNKQSSSDSKELKHQEVIHLNPKKGINIPFLTKKKTDRKPRVKPAFKSIPEKEKKKFLFSKTDQKEPENKKTSTDLSKIRLSKDSPDKKRQSLEPTLATNPKPNEETFPKKIEPPIQSISKPPKKEIKPPKPVSPIPSIPPVLADSQSKIQDIQPSPPLNLVDSPIEHDPNYDIMPPPPENMRPVDYAPIGKKKAQ